MVFVAVMVTLAAVGTSAQRVCDGAEIASDADAEAFAGCTSVTGTVTLTGSLSATGMALLNFTTAEEVSITGLTQLESLAGLALTAVTGSVRVASNPVLFSLDGLQALASVAGDLSIRDWTCRNHGQMPDPLTQTALRTEARAQAVRQVLSTELYELIIDPDAN